MKPITASVTRSEPPPEPVRPRLYVALCYDGSARSPWLAVIMPFIEHSKASRAVYGEIGARVITIPTDAEAEAHARYVAALEAEVAAWAACERETHGDYSDEDWKAAQRRLGECHGATMLARAEWEAESGKE